MPLKPTPLHYFLTAARARSFRQAADALHVEQSTVSRTIRRIEDDLGVSLFERGPGGVKLTDAGERFLSEALPAIERLEWAQRNAASAGRAEVGIVRVGILTSLAGGFLRRLAHHYAEHSPDVLIDIRDGAREDHIAAVRQHRLDVAFLTGSGNVPQCECAELWCERAHVALYRGHTLARRRRIRWSDLRREHFLVSSTAPGPEIHDFIIRRLADYVTYPDIEVKQASRETLFNLVGLGQGITVASAAWTAVRFPDLVLRPLAGEEDIVPFSAIWSDRNDNPALRRFLTVAHVLAGRARTGTSAWAFGTDLSNKLRA